MNKLEGWPTWVLMLSVLGNTILISDLVKAKEKEVVSAIDLNLSETARNQIAEECSVAMLNLDTPIGTIIHNAQFSCAMEINDEDEPETFKGLPAEDREMCETLDHVELYADGQGDYFFSPSSVRSQK